MPLEVIEKSASTPAPVSSSETTAGSSQDAPPGNDAVVAEAAQANQGGLTVGSEVKPNPKSFEALRASRAERLAAIQKPASPVVPPGPANTQAGAKPPEAPATANATVKVPIEPDKLDAFVKLNTELREKDTRIRELEQKATAFERFQQYEALVKAGKHVEAAKLIGFDMDKANLEILGASPDPQVDPRVEALEREIAALKANDQSRAQAEVSEAREAGRNATLEHVRSNAAEFPLLSKSERWVTAALQRAQAMHDTFVAKERRAMTMAEKDALVVEALKAEEAERAEDAKLLGAGANDPSKGSSNQQPQGSAGNMTITNANRGPVSNPGSTPKRKMTFEEVKRMRREARN